MHRFMMTAFVLTALGGCVSSARTHQSSDYDWSSPSPYSQSLLSLASPDDKGSLFPTDQAVLDNNAIRQIMSSQFTVHKDASIALLRFGRPRSYYWSSDELSNLNETILQRVKTKLESSDRIAKASLLPSMLIPERQSVPHIREAAARYQADLVLIYWVSSYSSEKQHVFQPDEVKAHCMVESVLLDTVRGLVPFATSASQEFVAKKTKNDFSMYDTVKKAETEAMGRALDQIATELVAFLDKTPTEPR